MRRLLTTLLSFSLCAAVVADAAVIVSNTWDYGAEGWNIIADDGGAAFGTLSDPAVLGGRNALRVTGPGAPEQYDADFVFSGGFAGDWTSMGTGSDQTVRSIRFDFYAGAGGAVDHPAGLRLYFEAAGEHVWYYTFDVESLSSGWNFLYANLNADSPSNLYGGTWWSETRTADDWAGDFGSVTDVGLWQAYQSGAGYDSQIYGLDHFELHDQIYIPEPGTWLMLGFVFLSMAVIFRKRLEELAVQAWARIRS